MPCTAGVASIQSSYLVAIHRLSSWDWNYRPLEGYRNAAEAAKKKQESKEITEAVTAWKIHFVWMGLRGHKSQAFAHLLKVKQKQSPDGLRCKDWDIYTSLPWGKAQLRCWNNLYAPGYPRSHTTSINRRKKPGRLSEGVRLVQRGGKKKLHRVPYSSLHKPDRAFQVM